MSLRSCPPSHGRSGLIAQDLPHPCGGFVDYFAQDLIVRPARPYRNVERMIGMLDQFQRRAQPNAATIGTSSRVPPGRRGVPCRNSIGTRTPAKCRARSSDGLFAGCSGKPKNTSPRTLRQRRLRLRLRRHPRAKRLAAGEQRQPRPLGRTSTAARTVAWASGRPVRSFRSGFHIGKLEPQRRDAAPLQSVGDGCHEWVRHPRPGAMRQDKAGESPVRDLNQARDRVCLIDPDGDRIRGHVRRRRGSSAGTPRTPAACRRRCSSPTGTGFHPVVSPDTASRRTAAVHRPAAWRGVRNTPPASPASPC